MATTRTSVTVLDGGVEVDTYVQRPVRLTPDGYAGIAYAGAVYPLREGDAVDLSGPSWEMADCERFLLAGAEIPYAPDSGSSAGTGFDLDWHLESNQFGHYVVFNATERQASRFVAALEGAGLIVQRWDVSRRLADDGNFYDWFARLRFKGRRDETLALIETVISPHLPDKDPTPATDPNVARIEVAEARIEELLDQLFALNRRAEAAEREAIRLREAVASVEANERSYRESLALADTRHRGLQQQIASLRDRFAGGPDIDAVLKDVADAEELREFALAENAMLLTRARNAEEAADVERIRGDGLADQVESLTDRVVELESVESERQRVSTASRPRRGGVAEFIPHVFSRLEFVLDAVEVVACLESPAAAMRTLGEIDSGRIVGRGLEGLPGWFEVSKVATGISGSESRGRIYYKPGGDRVIVSVHIKQDEKQQRRHIERLRTLEGRLSS